MCCITCFLFSIRKRYDTLKFFDLCILKALQKKSIFKIMKKKGGNAQNHLKVDEIIDLIVAKKRRKNDVKIRNRY